jgi:hypothetical protein
MHRDAHRGRYRQTRIFTQDRSKQRASYTESEVHRPSHRYTHIKTSIQQHGVTKTYIHEQGENHREKEEETEEQARKAHFF